MTLSIALLDGWATIADILSFYQERVVNEAYLTTAGQRESVEYLAKLVGCEPRQGLSSSVFLAFEVEDRGSPVMIPAGTPVKSTPVPGTGDQPQTFETTRDLLARRRWNGIRPRLSRARPGDG